jgi:hypothetical protein
MSQPTAITSAILDTVLALLAPFFLAATNGDLAAARVAAGQMLADYNAETREELRLAAEVISFGFQALEALSQAAAPDLPINRVMRLRGSAVSLNRSAQQNQRKLDQLQRARKAAEKAEATEQPQPAPAQPAPAQPAPAQPAPAQPAPAQPGMDAAAGLLEFARDAIQAHGSKNPRAWLQSAKKRRMVQKMAEDGRRRVAEHQKRMAEQARAAEAAAASQAAPNPAATAPAEMIPPATAPAPQPTA